MRSTHCLCLGAALVLLSCDSEAPTSARPDADVSSFSDVGNFGCHAVKGTITSIGIPPNFVGTIDGDLQGTAVTEVFISKFTGVVFHGPAVHIYTITGGTVPELVGQHLEVAAEVRTVFPQDNPLIGIINSTERVQSPGRGNLTVHGSLDFTAFPPALAQSEYSGVICP